MKIWEQCFEGILTSFEGILTINITKWVVLIEHLSSHQ